VEISILSKFNFDSIVIMKKPVFVNDHVYHIFNRGVEKRNIFMDDRDYFRFIHDLYEFNNEEQVANLNYYFNSKSRGVEKRYVKRDTEPRKLLVEVLVFTLMPNHYHLLLRQTRDNGIVKFMQSSVQVIAIISTRNMIE